MQTIFIMPLLSVVSLYLSLSLSLDLFLGDSCSGLLTFQPEGDRSHVCRVLSIYSPHHLSSICTVRYPMLLPAPPPLWYPGFILLIGSPFPQHTPPKTLFPTAKSQWTSSVLDHVGWQTKQQKYLDSERFNRQCGQCHKTVKLLSYCVPPQKSWLLH